MKLSSAALTGLWLWIFLPSLAYSQQEIQSRIALPAAQAVSTVPSLDDAGRPPKLPTRLKGEVRKLRQDRMFLIMGNSFEVSILSQTEMGRGYRIEGTYVQWGTGSEVCTQVMKAGMDGWYGNDGSGVVLRMHVKYPNPLCGEASLVFRPGNGHAFWWQDPDPHKYWSACVDPVE